MAAVDPPQVLEAEYTFPRFLGDRGQLLGVTEVVSSLVLLVGLGIRLRDQLVIGRLGIRAVVLRIGDAREGVRILQVSVHR